MKYRYKIGEFYLATYAGKVKTLIKITGIEKYDGLGGIQSLGGIQCFLLASDDGPFQYPGCRFFSNNTFQNPVHVPKEELPLYMNMKNIYPEFHEALKNI